MGISLIFNTYSLEELYKMHDETGATFVIEDGEITGVTYECESKS